MPPDPASASDPSLVLAVARFDESALAELYRRHAGAVFALAKRVLWDQAMAEEVVQEVFLRFWGHPERFDSERGSHFDKDAYAAWLKRLRQICTEHNARK